MSDAVVIERMAKAIHREWARHTVRHIVKRRPETDDEAFERRWVEMMPKVREEFLRLATVALEASR